MKLLGLVIAMAIGLYLAANQLSSDGGMSAKKKEAVNKALKQFDKEDGKGVKADVNSPREIQKEVKKRIEEAQKERFKNLP